MSENQKILAHNTVQNDLLPLFRNASSRSEQLQDAADATHFARINREKSQNTLKAYRQDGNPRPLKPFQVNI